MAHVYQASMQTAGMYNDLGRVAASGIATPIVRHVYHMMHNGSKVSVPSTNIDEGVDVRL